MAELFTREYAWLWGLVLAAALWIPVRQLIWVLMVRRAETKSPTDDEERSRLRRRAGFSAALLCFVFSMLYAFSLMPLRQ